VRSPHPSRLVGQSHRQRSGVVTGKAWVRSSGGGEKGDRRSTGFELYVHDFGMERGRSPTSSIMRTINENGFQMCINFFVTIFESFLLSSGLEW
jgi:hypothetical protein